MGVKCLAPEMEIWGVHFPDRSEEPAEADFTYVLLECRECASREMAALTVEQYRRLAARARLSRPCPECGGIRDWKLVIVEVGPGGISPSLPVPSASGLTSCDEADRRRTQTLAVKLPLEIRRPDGSEEITRTENISESGLCFACDLEMQIGDRVYVCGIGSSCRKTRHSRPNHVAKSRPGQGKGILWSEAGNTNDGAAAGCGPSAFCERRADQTHLRELTDPRPDHKPAMPDPPGHYR